MQPSLEQIKLLAKEYTVIPVCRSVLADTETPVSVFMKLFADDPHGFLLESVTGGELVARYSFLGGAPYMLFSACGDHWTIRGCENRQGSGNVVGTLRELLARSKAAPLSDLPRFTGGAVGFFAYDAVRYHEQIPAKNRPDSPLPDILFGFYRTVVAFDNREHRLVVIHNLFVDNADQIESEYAAAEMAINAIINKLSSATVSPECSIESQGEIAANFTRDEYERAVVRCKEYITAGDIFQVVLSQQFKVNVVARPFDVYRTLRIINPSPYMYYLGCGDAQIIGASPEMMVRVENNTVEVRPIAGTRRRGRTEAEDELLVRDLQSDPKEIAEHVMLVDLGRNDVGRVSVSGSIRWDNVMHIEKYSHVLHMVTDVKGALRPDCDAMDALFACFPAGTLSGAPKIRAMEIIDEQEPSQRGLYGGALGYIGFNGTLDTCIVIRTLVLHKGVATIQAGAGIVADSDPGREYEETLAKARALFTALVGTAQPD